LTELIITVYFSRDIEYSLLFCVRFCSRYFSATATDEILEEFRPQLCPTDSIFLETIKMLELFLPVNLPPEMHNQGFKFVYLFSQFFSMFIILDYG
jgi:proteasome activator subunit 4